MAVPPRPAVTVIVTGAPAVGKTTVSRAIAETLEQSAHVEADALHRFIVRGGVWPSAGTPKALRQVELRTLNALTLAANFVAEGIVAIVDEVFALPRQVELLDRLPGRVVIVGLAASAEVRLSRDESREKHTAASYLEVEELIRSSLGRRATWLDTTRMDADDTVAAVQRLLPFQSPLDDRSP